MKLGQRIYYPQLNIHGITKTAVTPNGKIRILCDDNVLRWALEKDLRHPSVQTVEQKQQEEIAILQKKLADMKRKLQKKQEQPHEPDDAGKEEIQARRAAILAEKIAAGEVSAETVASRSGSYD